MAKPPKMIMQAGERWVTVPSAAALLHTTTLKIRQLMGNDTLMWCQQERRATLLISYASILAYKQSEANPHRDKPLGEGVVSRDPLARQPGEPPKMLDSAPRFAAMTRTSKLV